MLKVRLLIINWVRSLLAPRPFIGIFYLPRYIKHYFQYRHLSSTEKVVAVDTYPCLLDATVSTPFDSHYFYQGAWLARFLSRQQPSLHIDVGSSVMMVSVLSGHVKTIFVDYRPLQVDLANLSSVGANITCLPFQDNSILSLSSQHVIEHIGLGRYGDPIDPEGSVKAAKELERVLKPGGKLYLSLPVGEQRVCFNAHRVHSPGSVIDMFSHMKLLEFSYVNDNGKFVQNGNLVDVERSAYACGMYVFEKCPSVGEV